MAFFSSADMSNMSMGESTSDEGEVAGTVGSNFGDLTPKKKALAGAKCIKALGGIRLSTIETRSIPEPYDTSVSEVDGPDGILEPGYLSETVGDQIEMFVDIQNSEGSGVPVVVVNGVAYTPYAQVWMTLERCHEQSTFGARYHMRVGDVIIPMFPVLGRKRKGARSDVFLMGPNRHCLEMKTESVYGVTRDEVARWKSLARVFGGYVGGKDNHVILDGVAYSCEGNEVWPVPEDLKPSGIRTPSYEDRAALARILKRAHGVEPGRNHRLMMWILVKTLPYRRAKIMKCVISGNSSGWEGAEMSLVAGEVRDHIPIKSDYVVWDSPEGRFEYRPPLGVSAHSQLNTPGGRSGCFDVYMGSSNFPIQMFMTSAENGMFLSTNWPMTFAIKLTPNYVQAPGDDAIEMSSESSIVM